MTTACVSTVHNDFGSIYYIILVMKRADKVEGTLKNFKEALPSVQKDLVELVSSISS